MHLSVERRNTPKKRHPVRDASLTGCSLRFVRTFSTERRIPNGMSKTMICSSFFNHRRNEFILANNMIVKYEPIKTPYIV